MATNKMTPNRIQINDDDGEKYWQDFFSRKEAKLIQDDDTYEGKLTITRESSTGELDWTFEPNSKESSIRFMGEVEIAADDFNVIGRIFSLGRYCARGYFMEPVLVGGDVELNSIRFKLPNYPDLVGQKSFDGETTDSVVKTKTSWSEILLEANGWQVRLQPHQDIFKKQRKSQSERKVQWTGLGEIQRSDSADFRFRDAVSLLEPLKIFLSFAFAEWSPPILCFDSSVTDVVAFLQSHETKPVIYPRGWLDEKHGYSLEEAFPGFMRLWGSESWNEPLKLAVNWLIESERRAGGVIGAIALSQIPLEMFTSLEDQKGKNAGIKIKSLLDAFGIPTAVPLDLPRLTELVDDTAHNFNNGPEIIVKVRNCIIHPENKNREFLANWCEGKDDLLWETLQLFNWYITLTLLRKINYLGGYSNRLNGDWDAVPWADSNEDEVA